jgi:hypothetical protein
MAALVTDVLGWGRFDVLPPGLLKQALELKGTRKYFRTTIKTDSNGLFVKSVGRLATSVGK